MLPHDGIDLFAKDSPFRLLADRAPAMLWASRADGTCSMLNAGWRTFRGLRQDDVAVAGWATGIHPDDHPESLACYLDAHREAKVFTLEYRVRRGDGQFRWVHDDAAPWFSTDGRFVGLIGQCVDVTDNRSQQTTIEQVERRLMPLVETSKEMVYRIQLVPAPSVEYMVGAVSAITGHTAEEFKHDPSLALRSVHPDDAPMLAMSVNDAARLPGAVVYRWMHADGRMVWAEHYRMPVFDAAGRVVALEGLARDITDRILSERRLRESEEQMRQLAARVEKAREEERAEVSRELHDQLGQTLTALKLELNRALQTVRTGTPQPAVIEPRLRAVDSLVDEGIATVKRLSSRLRPATLDHLGLADAVRSEAAAFSDRSGIRCQVRSNRQQTRLTAAQQTTLFRIAQEALNNVARHAHASAVQISITTSDREVELRVRDNGRGITPERIADPGSLGLIGMRERAALAGGTFSVSGQRGKGTVVTVRMPKAPRGPVDADRTQVEPEH